MGKLGMKHFERDSDCSVTITVQFYYVVEQGRPIAEADIKNAIDVCEEAYRGCTWDGNLMDTGFQAAFAKGDLTTSDKVDILTKAVTQPPSCTLFLKGSGPAMTNMTMVFPGSNQTVVPTANPNEPNPPPSAGVFDAKYNAFACLGDIEEKVKELPVSQAGYSWLLEAALARLSRQEQLDISFHLFRLANDLHVQVHGHPFNIAHYNMACCEAVAVALQIKKYRAAIPSARSLEDCMHPPETAGGVVAPQMPPQPNALLSSVKSLCEARLNAAMCWLGTAIGAGYRQHAHMATDPDLQVLRELRGPSFSVLENLAKTLP